MDQDSIQIRCTRCKTVFRDRAGRLQSGFSRQCPCCEVILFFDEDSQDANIKRAMRKARHARAELRDIKASGRTAASPQPASRRSSGRGRTSGRYVEPAE
jgi:predicted  nucleic acid-binding Zn-ribbon protein